MLTRLAWGHRHRSTDVPEGPIFETGELKMRREATAVLYVVLMAAIIVAVDFHFFRNRFWERLMANIGIVLVFGAFYLRFLKSP